MQKGHWPHLLPIPIFQNSHFFHEVKVFMVTGVYDNVMWLLERLQQVLNHVWNEKSLPGAGGSVYSTGWYPANSSNKGLLHRFSTSISSAVDIPWAKSVFFFFFFFGMSKEKFSNFITYCLEYSYSNLSLLPIVTVFISMHPLSVILSGIFVVNLLNTLGGRKRQILISDLVSDV